MKCKQTSQHRICKSVFDMFNRELKQGRKFQLIEAPIRCGLGLCCILSIFLLYFVIELRAWPLTPTVTMKAHVCDHMGDQVSSALIPTRNKYLVIIIAAFVSSTCRHTAGTHTNTTHHFGSQSRYNPAWISGSWSELARRLSLLKVHRH